MAKPFMPPDPQPEEGGTASGAGPPAGGAGGGGGATHNGGGPGQNENNPAPHQSYPGAAYHPMGSAVAGGPFVGSAPSQEPHPVLQMTPPASALATAVQTPQLGPVSGDHLMQVLYEALYRYSLGDGPQTPLSQSPPSASCSPFPTNAGGGGGGGGYHGGQVFFPRTPGPATGGRNGGRVFFHQSGTSATTTNPQPTPVSASSHSSSSGVSSSNDTPSCSSGTPHHNCSGQYQPIQFNWQDDGDSSGESESSSSRGSSSSSSGCSPHCGLSTDGAIGGSLAATAIIGSAPAGSTLYGGAGVPPHLDYMARREMLQEFPGQIPQRRRKSRTPKKPGVMGKPLMWQVAVTAALIVLGCSYLAAR
ncbi:trithorax group protein osa [Anopheles bellator]|uniref:trithorax group protein osa n=1 Tax=Anopheles bellator TaxID=139047 RepID=UPI002648B992|nr:trithorax group protein osa [Anopheles bellator]